VTDRGVLFARSEAGILDIAGRDREDFLQGLCTNDVLKPAGGALWAAALTPTGKVRFQFRAAPREDRIRLLLEPHRLAPAAEHFRKYAVFRDVRIEALSSGWERFDAYEGSLPEPSAGDRWPAFFEIRETVLVPAEQAPAFENDLAAAGALSIAAEDREARRIEAGRPMDGVDVDETRTPDEAGLSAAISTTKGCYVGQEVVARMRTYGRAPRRLVRFLFSGGPPAPAAGTRLVAAEGAPREAGLVTSAAWSPRRGMIALGYATRGVGDGELLAVSGDPERTVRVEELAGAPTRRAEPVPARPREPAP